MIDGRRAGLEEVPHRRAPGLTEGGAWRKPSIPFFTTKLPGQAWAGGLSHILHTIVGRLQTAGCGPRTGPRAVLISRWKTDLTDRPPRWPPQ